MELNKIRDFTNINVTNADCYKQNLIRNARKYENVPKLSKNDHNYVHNIFADNTDLDAEDLEEISLDSYKDKTELSLNTLLTRSYSSCRL